MPSIFPEPQYISIYSALLKKLRAGSFAFSQDADPSPSPAFGGNPWKSCLITLP